MEIRPLARDEAAIRRFVADLWIPYNRDLEAAVDDHALADDVDLVAEQTDFRLDRLENEDHTVWLAIGDGDAGVEAVAVDAEADVTDPAGPADVESAVGFVTTEVDESPSVFDRPDRFVIGDFYVNEAYRGTRLAGSLIGHVTECAQERDCAELALDVDVDNDRALAFYEKMGFEPRRHRMHLDVDEV